MVEGSLNYREKVSQLISWGHWFCLSNILIVLFVATRYLVISPWPETIQAQLFMLISWIGQFAFLPFIVFLLTLFPLSFLVTNRHTMRFIGAVIATIGVSALIIDTQIFANFHLHLNPLLWELLFDKESNTRATDINLLFILLPLIFLLELLLSRACWKNIRRLEHKRLGKPVAIGLMICFSLTHLIYAWADAKVYRPITTQKVNYPLFYPMTARSFLDSYGFIDIERRQEKASQGSDKAISPLSYPTNPLDYAKRTQDYNVLIIVVEGLRADALNAILMPNTKNFAERSTRFNAHFSGSNCARYGLYSLFYGLPSSYQSSVHEAGISPVLIQALQKQDYEFGLFSSKKWDETDLSTTAFAGLPSPQFGTDSPGGAAGDMQALNAWSAWQAEHGSDAPWFNFVYLNGVASFDNQSGFNNKLPSADQLHPIYNQAVTLVDEKLGDIFRQLELNERLNDTMVILTSDYGQEFNDRNDKTLGSGSNYSTYQTQVPFLLYTPNRTPTVVSYDTSHLDLVGTLLPDLLGVQNRRRDYTSGQSLFDRSRRNWVLAGDLEEQAIYQSDRITLFGKNGEYDVRNRDYQRIKASADMPVLIEVLNEMKRFYRTDH
jgi:membrane-anchored protein YejM (alkaline phosphatase superfamily)